MHSDIVGNSQELLAVSEKKYQFLSAMLHCVNKNMDRGYIKIGAADRLLDSLVKFSITDKDLSKKTLESFKKERGIYPPSFIVLSPTQRCNLKCTDCYASSSISRAGKTLDFQTLDKIVGECYNEWGNRFMTFSGGEPLIYQDSGKTLFDIWKKYPEMFFLLYTNGTLIDKEKAERIAELGNVTPTISIEGFKEETDERRGDGSFRKIMGAFENLKKAGVPFGASVTATRKNFSVLNDDKFYDFLFNEGINYMWLFQLMPIGQAKDARESMITPQQRVSLLREWEHLLGDKKYCIADFWNSGVLSNGCIAYGRNEGYLYVDWNGNIMPCVFVPYYMDNIKELHKQGKKLADALFSDMFVRGREWQDSYGLRDLQQPKNWLMPCSIRDHYLNFKYNIARGVKAADESAESAIRDPEHEKMMKEFDSQLAKLTQPIWDEEYLNRK